MSVMIDESCGKRDDANKHQKKYIHPATYSVCFRYQVMMKMRSGPEYTQNNKTKKVKSQLPNCVREKLRRNIRCTQATWNL
ncbi:hypothetical protein GCM10023092_22650 [Rurimicrobium arvi]|uniref:Uncharacterized protein n=1 Tax=Rurimicrobium arvi TaxID=2049916 RepID=A0ABP8MY10_9BACT